MSMGVFVEQGLIGVSAWAHRCVSHRHGLIGVS
jgi:hypothetical protein